MRSKLYNLTKVILALVLCCGMFLSAVPSVDASAAKMTNKKAHKILNKKIKNKFCRYLYVDLDKDNIDELIVLGFSGKFVDGDDEVKTLNVYRISGKKAKSVLNYSVEGDFYHPTLSFNLYYDKASYITINHEHEGYAYYITYKYNKGKFKEVAVITDAIAENEQFYTVDGKEGKTEKDYDKFMKNILANEVDYVLASPSTKVANDYLQKMLQAEFDFRKDGLFEYDDVSAVFSDEDGDGIDEMIVREGPQNGMIFYVRFPNDKSASYGVGYTKYTIKEGHVVYEIPNFDYDDEEGDEDWGPVDGEEYCGKWQCDRCGIDIVREGAAAFVFDIKWGSSAFETDQWIYFAFYQGTDSDGNPVFTCDGGGSHVRQTSDAETGEDNIETIGMEESAEFVIIGDKLYWHNLSDDSIDYDSMEFVKID